ncbi:MAG: response regulator transcription factor [Burkholderiales bacterium]|nr:response regulator transcription factor [Burkholderiales bacterium]
MAPSLKIVMVEDNEVLRTLTIDYLVSRGHLVTGYAEAESVIVGEGLSEQAQNAEIFLLDVNLPGKDGLTLAKHIRSQRQDVGIIMMTARTNELDKIQGYEVGADIYLPKPCSLEQLNAAIGSLGRRMSSDNDTPNRKDISFSLQTLRLDGPLGHTELTGTEGRLMDAFYEAEKGLLTYEVLAKLLGRVYSFKDWQVFAVNVTRLRKKLTDVGAPDRCIVSVRSVGYQCCIKLARI